MNLVHWQVDGDYHYDSRKQTLLWTVDLIDDSNRQGAMEFVISSAANPDSFFPVDVSFSAQHTLADVKVVTVSGTARSQRLQIAQVPRWDARTVPEVSRSAACVLHPNEGMRCRSRETHQGMQESPCPSAANVSA